MPLNHDPEDQPHHGQGEVDTDSIIPMWQITSAEAEERLRVAAPGEHPAPEGAATEGKLFQLQGGVK